VTRLASGLRAWTWQRLSGLWLALFTPVLLWRLLWAPPADYPAWHGWVARPAITLGLILYLAALCMHAWVGGRDILMDYVSHPGARLALLGGLAAVLIACALGGLGILYRI